MQKLKRNGIKNTALNLNRQKKAEKNGTQSSRHKYYDEGTVGHKRHNLVLSAESDKQEKK
jgi:hypothetical protein